MSHDRLTVILIYKIDLKVEGCQWRPQQEKIQRTEEKRCTVNHVAEFKNGTPILKERRFGGILYWCNWGAPNGVICCAPFLLLFWSSVSTPLLEFSYYSSFGAPLLLFFWSSVSRALLLNPIGANWNNY